MGHGKGEAAAAVLLLFKHLRGESCSRFPTTKTNLGEKRKQKTNRESIRFEKSSLERPASFRAGYRLILLTIFFLLSAKPGESRRSPRSFSGGSGCRVRGGHRCCGSEQPVSLPCPSRCSPRAGGLRSRLLPQRRGSAPPSIFSASFISGD